ncbi:MAG: hypothetical protein II667_06290 [Clostridiales bacterium]|nr:hypothetical protein [Clostridiales bacterium]
MARDPRVRSFVLVAVMGISVLAGIAAIHSELDENTRNIIACISIAVVIVGFILHQILVRCPHCGRWIRRPRGECCRYCGMDYSSDEIVNDDDHKHRH